MKNSLSIVILLLCFCILPCISFADDMGIIKVTGRSVKEIMPDTLHVIVEVQTLNKNAQDAMKENSQKTAAVLKALEGLVCKNSKDSVETHHISVNPQYRYNKNEKKLLGYIARNSIKVKTKNTKIAGKMISVALNNGANKIGNLYFMLDDNEKHCNSLISDSVKSAYKRATVIANSLGTSILRIKTIRSSCNTGFSYSPRFFSGENSALTAAKKDLINTPIRPRKIKLKATTNAEFYIKK